MQGRLFLLSHISSILIRVNLKNRPTESGHFWSVKDWGGLAFQYCMPITFES